MTVYFIQAQDNEGLIKIGETGNLSDRFAVIQSHCPIELSIIGVMNGGKELEGNIHSTFDSLRVRGEWFMPRSDLLDFIKSNSAPYHKPRQRCVARLRINPNRRCSNHTRGGDYCSVHLRFPAPPI